MKLHKVEDYTKCCKYCKFYSEHICHCKEHSIDLAKNRNVYSVSEDGYLSSVIEETLFSENPIDLYYKPLFDLLSEYKVSNKRMEKVKEVFTECYNENMNGITYLLDKNISILYEKMLNDGSTGELFISSPEIFTCNNWQ